MELPFSEFLETEADKVGLHLAVKAAYDIKFISKFLRRLKSDCKNKEIICNHSLNDSNKVDEIEKLVEKIK